MNDTSKTLRYQVLQAVQTCRTWHSILEIDRAVRGNPLAGSNSSVTARLSDAYNAGLIDRKQRTKYTQSAMFKIKPEYQSTPVQQLDDLLTTWVAEQAAARTARRKAEEAAQLNDSPLDAAIDECYDTVSPLDAAIDARAAALSRTPTASMDIVCPSGAKYTVALCDMKALAQELNNIVVWFK